MWIFLSLLVILLFFLLLLTIFHYATRGRKYWFFRNVPYREPCPIFGNFGATFTMKRSYSTMLKFFYDRYKDEKYVGIFQARRPTLMVIDLDIVKTVLSKEFQCFGDRVSVSTDTRREPLLRNLANMSGAEWKAMRHIVTPTFSSAKMKAMFPLIAACGQALRDVLLNESLDEVNVPAVMMRFTTDVIGSCAFGVDPGSLKNSESPFLKMSQKMFRIDRATLLKRYCRAFFPRLFKFLNLRSYSSDVEVFFTTIINQVLEERRSGVQRHDFLQLMLNEQKTESGFSMTDALITSNSFIFMLAGLETSSTTLSFCLYELAKDKDIQDSVRREIKDCLERHNGLNYDAVSAMRFVAQVVAETLRLHPPTPMTTRLCTAPCALDENLSLKEKDVVLIPIQCIQRDERYFPNPNKFDPSRFEESLGPPGFLAYGDGPRNCPGARFAQLTVSTGLAIILTSFEVEPCALTTPTIQYDPRSVMLKNKGGIWLRFRAIVLEVNILERLNENRFIENCLEILIDFCNVKEYKHSFLPNVSLSLLERRNELEVRAQKNGDVSVSSLDTNSGPPPPTVALVTSLADALYNLSAFPKCPVQQWNEQGLYRLLFRCTSWSCDVVTDTHAIRAASCRALLAVTSHKCVRVSLATTKDCLHNLLMILTPFGEDDMNGECLRSRAEALSLLASLLVERSAIDSVWRYLKENLTLTVNLLHLLLQCLESDELELQDAALYCLTQLAQSMSQKKYVDNTKDQSCSELYDSLKSPFWELALKERGAGDSARSRDCQPEYLAEELCKALINLHQKSIENKDCELSQDERWVRVCSCLSSVLAVSGRSRRYALHRRLSRLLLVILQMVRDRLSMEGKSADVIRNTSNNPVLFTLYWVLTLIDCSMVQCAAAKETYADENIVVYLCRLWCWCMMTEQLRNVVVHLLYTFTNDCPKAWSGACACVGGRALAGELCALVAREAPRRAAPALVPALRALRRAAANHHCRAILLKSEAIESVYRVCMRWRVRGVGGASAALEAWARLCEAVARHADGAASLLSVRGGAGGAAGPAALWALPPHARALLLPALAHAAHHHRQTFLQSAELLSLLCDTLLGGDTAEVVSATRAVWALAANNHKAKLALRSAGVAAAIQTALQRLRRISGDSGAQKAIQLLMYTNTVLQTA